MRRFSRASRRWRATRTGRTLRSVVGVAALTGSTLMVAAAPAAAATPAGTPAAAVPAAAPAYSYVTTAFSPTGGGWQSTAAGHVTAFGGEAVYGTLDGHSLNQPIVGMASTPDGHGYWLVASDGGIFSFGDAAFYGSTGAIRLAKPVVGMASTPDGHGYWLVASDGGVFSFGDAAFYGSTGAIRLTKPVVGMASTPDGHGYWLVASDGGIFTFGDATFYGSTGAIRLAKPVVGMASSPDGHGYWLVASDGGVFTFGDATFYGSEGGQALAQPVIGMAPMAQGGYSLIAADAGYQTFGPGTAGSSATTPPTSTTPTSPTTAPPAAPAGPTLAVLAGNPAHLSSDQAAGVKMVTVLLDWSQFEPVQGQFDSSYISYVQGLANQYRAAGMNVAVDPGLQHPPSWATGLPDGRFVDQNGTASYLADFAWSQAVRDAGTAYLDQVVAAMGPVVDYRVGLSENGETMLPGTSSNQWWAFTPSAQGTAAGLPAGVAPSPMPGWVPGTPTWNGQAVSVAQASNWYDWYFSGSSSAVAWEISAYRSAGYTGQIELVMPGMGSLPAFFNQRLGNLLVSGQSIGQHYDDFYTLNTGAVWWKLLDALPDLSNVAIDVSSVDDLSGSPRGNGCTAADASVDPNSSSIWAWSDTRYLTYLAGAHHLPIMGENPGNTPASDLPTIMNLVHSCGLTALQWAWDNNLYANDGSATMAQLQSAFFSGS